MNRLMASGLLPGDFRDSSVVHVRDALRIMEDACVVRHDDDRAIGMDGVAREQRHDRFAAGMIQGCGGLVADDQAWLVDERPGEGDALLLAGEELRGPGLDSGW